LKATTLTRENIEVFVHRFYENTIYDEEIGHFFTELLGDDIKNKKWQEHIDILIEFWCAMLLKDGDYYGSPFAPHIDMKLTRASFDRWLVVLDNTLDELYEEVPAKKIAEVGEIICNSFMERLGL